MLWWTLPSHDNVRKPKEPGKSFIDMDPRGDAGPRVKAPKRERKGPGSPFLRLWASGKADVCHSI